MSDKYAALKRAAEKATWGDWTAYQPHKGARGHEVKVGIKAVAQHCLKNDAGYIALAGPKVVLELLAERDADKARIADQREVMRQAAADIAYAIFNLTGADISRLSPGVVESTDPTDTALIAERNLRAAAGISLKIEGE